jgi:hypothetical protein
LKLEGAVPISFQRCGLDTPGPLVEALMQPRARRLAKTRVAGLGRRLIQHDGSTSTANGDNPNCDRADQAAERDLYLPYVYFAGDD